MATLDDYARINEGLALYHDGQAWHAHEAWEAAWKTADGVEKATLQALIQVAAAVHKHRDDALPGVIKNLDKAAANLESVRAQQTACLGVDIVDLHDQVTRTLAVARSFESIPAAPGAFTTPALPRTTGPDGFVYLHGFASSPRSYKASQIVPALEDHGWSVAVPDLNEDDFSRLTITRALARTRRCMRDRTILIGSSLGGYLSSLLQADDDRVVAAVLMAPAYDFIERLRQRYGPALRRWAEAGVVEVEHYGLRRLEPIRYTLVTDSERYPSRPALRVPGYVLQGRNDDVVPADMVTEVVNALPEGLVQLEVVEDDHTLGTHVDRARAAAVRFAEQQGFRPDPR